MPREPRPQVVTCSCTMSLRISQRSALNALASWPGRVEMDGTRISWLSYIRAVCVGAGKTRPEQGYIHVRVLKQQTVIFAQIDPLYRECYVCAEAEGVMAAGRANISDRHKKSGTPQDSGLIGFGCI